MRTVGLAAAVLALAAPAAGAAVPRGNLVTNPGAESGPAAENESTVVPPARWTTTTGFSAVRYGNGGFPDLASSAAIGGGRAFFAGGVSNEQSRASQRIDVSGAAAEIDTGRLRLFLAAWLGGFAGQNDQALVSATFLNDAGRSVGSAALTPVTALERGNVTGFVERRVRHPVPRLTRAIEVTITSTRASGSYNDGYADNVRMTLDGSEGEAEPSATQPAAGGTETGTVRVRRPGGAYETLGPSGVIPPGSTVDATAGTVRLTTGRPGGGVQTGLFSGGVFKFTQARELVRGKRRFTARLALQGGSFASCGKRRRDASAARRRVVRFLKARASGRFRVIGRRSSGVERGTEWTTSDGCDGTLTSVSKGSVEVFDFGRRRTVVVRAGRSYLARAPR